MAQPVNKIPSKKNITNKEKTKMNLDSCNLHYVADMFMLQAIKFKPYLNIVLRLHDLISLFDWQLPNWDDK